MAFPRSPPAVCPRADGLVRPEIKHSKWLFHQSIWVVAFKFHLFAVISLRKTHSRGVDILVGKVINQTVAHRSK